ncbi:nucleotide sugar dehydrogenase [Mumia sp. ZJ1417]|uniref:nucleotide sugar dehydrogenase n=1 Tax=Mumia sp. ZJ1417 TaxID=2708082 RepID=UPI00141DEDD1|nr:nucleotide sugar dehydrogenase [Mumia sp. ZJ1417]QMW66882.1 nucleotide sugar dehydrogenase [Mumia sp. ZJ1417]
MPTSGVEHRKGERMVVVGQGYVGLPVAVRAVEAEFDVVGFDTDEARVASLRSGISFVEDVTDSVLRTTLATGRYLPTTDVAHVDGFDCALVTVPTPLREAVPDLTFVEDAARLLGPRLRPGNTVVLESTTYPGTTEQLLAPLLGDLSGMEPGVDFNLGYSPERIDPGNTRFAFTTTPKVVSGVTAKSAAAVEGIYARLVDRTVPVSSTAVAELTKLLENTFRHVNVALVNELAMFAHDLDIDVWEAISAASTKPFGFMPFTPGPGVGGDCLPVDPSYLSWQVRRTLGQSFRFVELANDVNDHMPEYVVRRLSAGLNERSRSLRGSRVLAVGLAYKPRSSDTRGSPAVRVCELLVASGADVRVVDPYVDESKAPAGVSVVTASLAEVEAAHAIVILTDHDGVDYDAIARADAYVLDTRNRLNHPGTAL